MTFGVYIHVPFCATRCGYCDFNTYTLTELGSPWEGQPATEVYLAALARELALAARETAAEGTWDGNPVDTVFVGGGTPSLLGAAGLTRVLAAVRSTFGIAPTAEVTTESNPESTSPEFFAGIREAGFTRVSLGMQSIAPHVLAVLERTHTPGRAIAAATEAEAAGFEHINLDLIYATPTETDDDVRASVEAAVSTGIDHLSAYSLIVEPGTRLARRISHGECAPESTELEDIMARRYELIDELLTGAGFGWYEVSNWAKPGGECRHNLGYWRSDPWWGAGPGAHSFLTSPASDGDSKRRGFSRRFFNVKHPRAYADLLLNQGTLPIQESETLTETERYEEQLMLGLRLREGIPLDLVRPSAMDQVNAYIRAGLLETFPAASGLRLRVSDAGRLHADGIVVDLL